MFLFLWLYILLFICSVGLHFNVYLFVSVGLHFSVNLFVSMCTFNVYLSLLVYIFVYICFSLLVYILIYLSLFDFCPIIVDVACNVISECKYNLIWHCYV